jgi:hypothetical protein
MTPIKKNERHIQDRFQVRGIWHGQELLFDLKTALEVVEECRTNRIGILGLDFYKKIDTCIDEVDGYGADFSQLFRDKSAVLQSQHATLKTLMNELPRNADYVSFVFFEKVE